MALIVRIISADGKKIISKVLPAMPSHLKVPAGAHVEVIDKTTGVRQSLGRYMNDHARHDDKHDPHFDQNADKVTVEQVQTWQEAEAWLTHMDRDLSYDVTTADWFGAGLEPKQGAVLGLDKTPLIIGAGLGGLAAVGAAVASGGGGHKKDIVAPLAPTGVKLLAADDTGSSSTDNITSKKTVTITGSAEPGSSVELFDASNTTSPSLGKATAGSDGVFSKQVDLTEGVHNIVARATDNAGNTGLGSTAVKITVDVTGPAAPAAPDLATADDTGASSTDNITNLSTGLTLTGTVDAGATVELFDGTTSLGKTNANATTGAYSIDVALAEGTHSVTAVVTDLAGNAGTASPALTIIVDQTVPLAPTSLDLQPSSDDGSSSTDNVTSLKNNLTFSGTAEPGSTVQLVDGINAVATGHTGTNGQFLISLATTTVGDHNFSVRTIDDAGNTSATAAPLLVHVVAAPQAAEISGASPDVTAALLSNSTGLDETGHNGVGSIA